MATKISGMTTVTTPASTDQFETNQGGTTYNTTRAQVHTLESGESFTGENAAAPSIVDEAASATNPTLIPDKSDLDTGVGHQAADSVSLVAGGAEAIRAEDPADLGATETSLWLYDLDNGAIQQVTVGAADSGGSGFKVLRIVN